MAIASLVKAWQSSCDIIRIQRGKTLPGSCCAEDAQPEQTELLFPREPSGQAFVRQKISKLPQFGNAPDKRFLGESFGG
jgi:hypothetical protein